MNVGLAQLVILRLLAPYQPLQGRVLSCKYQVLVLVGAGLPPGCCRPLSTGQGALADLAALLGAWQAEAAYKSPAALLGSEAAAAGRGGGYGQTAAGQSTEKDGTAQFAEEQSAGAGVMLVADALHLPDAGFRVSRLLQAALVLGADAVAVTERMHALAGVRHGSVSLL